MNNLPKNVFPEDVVYNNGKTPEEEALHRLYCKKLIDRMLTHPELVPLGSTRESVQSMLTDGSIDNPQLQDFAFEAETYFEFKDEMASKGIKVFNASIEHACSSEQVQRMRAQKMVEYFLSHKSLLCSDKIDEKDLANQNFIKKGFYFMANAWCYVLQLKLAGIELFSLDDNKEEKEHFWFILEPLIVCKKEGVFNE